MNIEEIKLPWSDFQLVRRIGSGGYGEVYEAVRRISDTTEEHSAVKIITIPQNEAQLDQIRYQSGESFESTEAYIQDIVEDCKHEIEAMASLKYSPNICNLEDFRIVSEFNQEMNITQYQIFIREELLQPVHEYSDTGRLEEKDVVKMGLDVCSALEVLETKNYVHRDVSPSNILISEHGNTVTFKLCDFGVARRLESLNSFLSRKGKSFYMPPELVSSKGTGTTTDIYGLGMTMYWYLNGNRFPFVPDTKIKLPSYYEKAEEIRVNNLQEISAPVNASPDLAKIVLKAISFHPENRYQSASDFKHALFDFTKKSSGDIVISSPDDIVVSTKISTHKISDETNKPQNKTKKPTVETFDEFSDLDEKDYKLELIGKRFLELMPAFAIILIRVIYCIMHIDSGTSLDSSKFIPSLIFLLIVDFISRFIAKHFKQNQNRKLPVLLSVLLLGLIMLSKYIGNAGDTNIYTSISFQLPVIEKTITFTPSVYAPLLIMTLFAFYSNDDTLFTKSKNFKTCVIFSMLFLLTAFITGSWASFVMILVILTICMLASIEEADEVLVAIREYTPHTMIGMSVITILLRLCQMWKYLDTHTKTEMFESLSFNSTQFWLVILLLVVLLCISLIFVFSVSCNLEWISLVQFEQILCYGALCIIICYLVLILFETFSFNPVNVYSPAIICYAFASELITTVLKNAAIRERDYK